MILGREGCGQIVSTPSPFPESTRVGFIGTSSYAEYTACAAAHCLPIPSSIKSAIACASLLQGLTALTLISEAHAVQRGEWILVLAASGGTGGWLCRLLRARGAKTIATVGRKEKVKAAEEGGADVVLVEGEDDILAVVQEKTNGEGVRAVFDGVGKDTFERSLECVGRKGTLVSFGNASGAVEPFSIL